MKTLRILLFPLLFISLSAFSQVDEEKVNIRLSNESFSGFVEQVESQSDLLLFYNPEWFEGRSFSFREIR